MLSYSAIRKTLLADGESVSKTFSPQRLPHHQWIHAKCIWGKNILSLQPKSLEVGNGAGCHDILKSLKREGVICLTRLYQLVWCFGRAPEEWQTGVIIPINKKGDRRKMQCDNHCIVSLLSLFGNKYVKWLKQRCLEKNEP